MVKKSLKTRMFGPPETERWNTASALFVEQYLSGTGYPGSGGVSIGDVQIRLKVVPLQGMKTSPVDGSSKKVFGKEEADVPIQLALATSPAPDPRFIVRGPMTLKDRFPPKCRVVLTKGKYRGCIGTVLSTNDEDKVGVKVQVIPPEPPFGLAIARGVQESYISSHDAAKILRIDPRTFARVTGNLFFSPGKYDLGLNLTYRDKKCVLGYTRVKKDPSAMNNKKKDANAWSAGDTVLVVGSRRMSTNDQSDSGGDENRRVFWEYTPKAVRLVAAYKRAFPNLFTSISRAPGERFYDAKKVFGPKGDEICAKILDWLKSTETATMPRLPHTTEAMPVAAVHAVQRAADVRSSALEKDGTVKESNVKVPPSALYREGSTAATDILLASEHSVFAPPELGDRVANLCANGVPFGARGTVVAIHDPSEGCVEVVMDEEFIGGSTLQGTCSNFRGKLCVWNHLLKISAADSKGIIDNVIPAGAAKAAIDTLICSIQEVDAIPADGKIAPAVSPSRTNLRQATPTRSNSAARGGVRQGAWREARGPPEKILGFTKYRKASNGLEIWKELNDQNSNCVDRAGEDQMSNSAGVLRDEIGVRSDPSNLPTSATDATEGLKALLGVAGNIAQQNTKQPPGPPKTVADMFLQLIGDEPAPVPPQGIPGLQASRPAFNFTYVKDGEEQPTTTNVAQEMTMITTPMAMMPQLYPPHFSPMHMMPPNMAISGNGISYRPINVSDTTASKTVSTTTPAKKGSSIVPSVVLKAKR